jgi:hypothetical protein
MKSANRVAAGSIVESADHPAVASCRLPAEQLFAGQRPASWRRGVEPAFFLLEREVLAQLHAAAEALSVAREVLVARIAHDHLDEY